MLVGVPPFYTDNRQELFERIKFASPKYPSNISDTAKNLLEKLLKKDPTKRLGHRGAQEIKSHPWFEEVDWDKMLNKEYNALFVPVITERTDLQHFDREFTEIEMNSLSMSNSNKHQYPNYDGMIFKGLISQDSATISTGT